MVRPLGLIFDHQSSSVVNKLSLGKVRCTVWVRSTICFLAGVPYGIRGVCIRVIKPIMLSIVVSVCYKPVL